MRPNVDMRAVLRATIPFLDVGNDQDRPHVKLHSYLHLVARDSRDLKNLLCSTKPNQENMTLVFDVRVVQNILG